MTIAVLYPRREYAATGEQVAGWQTLSRLRRGDEVAEVVYYDEDEAARDVVADVFEPHVLVVLDPLAIVDRSIAFRLRTELGARSVIVPAQPELMLYLCTVETLREEKRPLRQAIEGREIAIATSVPVQKWERPISPDLLPFIPTTAHSILHVGCGNGTLGERIKQRQRCRVVGIEVDRELSSAAKRRIDDVYLGDIAEIVSILHEELDCIVTTGVLEQTADPWSLLAELRRLSSAGGLLVAGIPNVAHARVIAELAEGHFDPAKQLRFFTRESVEEMMDIAGWKVETIETPGATDDTAWFIVIARHEG
jgi:SAM-dependent methyltransferase